MAQNRSYHEKERLKGFSSCFFFLARALRVQETFVAEKYKKQKAQIIESCEKNER